LSQQIKQINSIEHKKISGMSTFGKPGISVGISIAINPIIYNP
jgi:hypothetical protein